MIMALPFLLAASAVSGSDVPAASSGPRVTIHASAQIVASQRVSFIDILQQDERKRPKDRQITQTTGPAKQVISTVEFY